MGRYINGNIISSEKGNNYFISRSIPQVIFLHPILNYLLKLTDKGIRLSQWIKNLSDDEIEIEKGIFYKKKEVLYYYKYFLFLKKNNYFKAQKKYDMTGTRYTAEMIKRQLANTEQIVFETTESCNLRCKYCGYGDLYSDFDNRQDSKLSIKTARRIFDYMVDLFESPLNRKSHKRIAISFYGGEPLLNMPFIKEMVKYAQQTKLRDKDFFFSMTTNGVLLDKYMDFLESNNFILLISLDGCENHNFYRIFPGGTQSYQKVYNNIKKLQEKFPNYFEINVNFMAVLHNKNTHKEINRFFRDNFGKDPLISEVNSIGIRPDKNDEFNKLFNVKYSGFTPEDILRDIQNKDRILKTPFVREIADFIHRYSGFVFKTLEKLLYKTENAMRVATGTCNPFEKKIFITSKGKILPCERILSSYSLGSVDENGVYIDFKKIAEKYNEFYRKMMNNCNKCYKCDNCPTCIFRLDLEADIPVCNNYMSKEELNSHLSRLISILEEISKYYPCIMRDYQIN